ncbi:MAG: hypothetical protein AMXMBFR52_09490 [Burkholderiales bacterium]
MPFGPVADVVLPLCPLDLLDPLDRFEALPVVLLLRDAFLRGLSTGTAGSGPSDM